MKSGISFRKNFFLFNVTHYINNDVSTSHLLTCKTFEFGQIGEHYS